MGPRWAKALVLIGWVAPSGCASEPTTEVAVAVPATDAGDAIAEGEDGADDSSMEGSDEVGETEAGSAAPMAVALAPTPASVLDGGSEQESEAEALIAALAAGSRGVVLDVSWSGTSDDSGTPTQAAWGELGAKLTFVRQQHRTALVSLATVDGALDGRPAGLQSTPWSGVATRDAVHASLDAAMSVASEEVTYLSLGMEVDRYLTTYPEQAAAYVAFVLEAMQYVREHPERPQSLRVGVTWSAGAWLPNATPTSNEQQLRDGVDAMMLSFWALDTSGHALDPKIAAATLGSAVDNVEDMPVVLHQVAYASSPLLGSSEAWQADFMTSLFDELEARVGSVPFVGIASLHDPAQTGCVSFAEARGSPDSTEMFAFWCSTGLRQRSGAPKDAFEAYVEAASRHEQR